MGHKSGARRARTLTKIGPAGSKDPKEKTQNAESARGLGGGREADVLSMRYST